MKTNKVILFLSLIFLNCGISFPLWGDIEDLYSIADLKPIVQRKMKEYMIAPDDTLLAVGLDRVIFHPTDLPFQVQNIYQHRQILRNITNEISQEHKYLLYNFFTKKGPLELIESATPEILSDLQRNIKAIGLTAYLIGPIDGVENNEAWAAHTLKDQFKIDFSNAFEGVDDLELKEAPAYRGKLPRYYKGILHANGRGEEGSKGQALSLLLKQIGYQPRLIFFMDDIKEHLTLVEEELKKYNPDTHFVGLNYRYREIGNRDKLIDAETFERTWRNLAEECRPKK